MLATATPGDLFLRDPAAAAAADEEDSAAATGTGAATVAITGVVMIGIVKTGGVTIGIIGGIKSWVGLDSVADEAEAAELRFFREAPEAAAAADEAAAGAG